MILLDLIVLCCKICLICFSLLWVISLTISVYLFVFQKDYFIFLGLAGPLSQNCTFIWKGWKLNESPTLNQDISDLGIVSDFYRILTLFVSKTQIRIHFNKFQPVVAILIQHVHLTLHIYSLRKNRLADVLLVNNEKSFEKEESKKESRETDAMCSRLDAKKVDHPKKSIQQETLSYWRCIISLIGMALFHGISRLVKIQIISLSFSIKFHSEEPSSKEKSSRISLWSFAHRFLCLFGSEIGKCSSLIYSPFAPQESLENKERLQLKSIKDATLRQEGEKIGPSEFIVDPTIDSSDRSLEVRLLIANISIEGAPEPGFCVNIKVALTQTHLFMFHDGPFGNRCTNVLPKSGMHANLNSVELIDSIDSRWINFWDDFVQSQLMCNSKLNLDIQPLFNYCLPLLSAKNTIVTSILLESRIELSQVVILSFRGAKVSFTSKSVNRQESQFSNCTFASESNAELKDLLDCSSTGSFNVNLSLNQMAETFFYYWRWYDEHYPHATSYAEPVFDDNFNPKCLSWSKLTIPVSIECSKVKVILFERSHPTVMVCRLCGIDARIQHGKSLLAIEVTTVDKLEVFTVSSTSHPRRWWRHRAAADLKLQGYNPDGPNFLNQVFGASPSHDNVTSSLSGKISRRCLRLAHATKIAFILQTTKKPKYPYTQHVRLHSENCSTLWIPDGILTWVYFILYAQRVYKHARKLVYAKREERKQKMALDILQTAQRETDTLGLCERCGELKGTRFCHVGLRHKEDWDPHTLSVSERLKLECQMPCSIFLHPSLCDVAAVDTAINDLDDIEMRSKETFDVKIGNLWVIADPVWVDYAKEVQYSSSASILSTELFTVHYSTAAAATIIGALDLKVFCVDTIACLPPQCPTSVSTLWKSYFDHSSSQLRWKEKGQCSLCGETQALAIKIPSTGASSISIQTTNGFCNFNPSCLDLVWLIAEETFVSYLTTRRWGVLSTVDFPMQSGIATDMFVSIGLVGADWHDLFKVTCRSMLLYKDGPTGTMDVVLNEFSVHPSAKLSTSKFFPAARSMKSGPLEMGMLLPRVPPLLFIDQIRIWSGYQSMDPTKEVGLSPHTQTTECRLGFADASPRPFKHVPLSVAPKLNEPSYLLARCIKIAITNLEVNLMPEFPLKKLQEALQNFFEPILERISVPEPVYRLMKACKPEPYPKGIPSPVAYLDIDVGRMACTMLIGLSPNSCLTNLDARFEAAERADRRIYKDRTKLTSGLKFLKQSTVWGSNGVRSVSPEARIKTGEKVKPRNVSCFLWHETRMNPESARNQQVRGSHNSESIRARFSRMNEYAYHGGSTGFCLPGSGTRRQRCCVTVNPKKESKQPSQGLNTRPIKSFRSVEDQIGAMSCVGLWRKLGTPILLAQVVQLHFHWVYHSGAALAVENFIRAFPEGLTEKSCIGRLVATTELNQQPKGSLSARLQNSPEFANYRSLARTSTLMAQFTELVISVSKNTGNTGFHFPIVSQRSRRASFSYSNFNPKPLSIFETQLKPNCCIQVFDQKQLEHISNINFVLDGGTLLEFTGTFEELYTHLRDSFYPRVSQWWSLENSPSTTSRPSCDSDESGQNIYPHSAELHKKVDSEDASSTPQAKVSSARHVVEMNVSGFSNQQMRWRLLAQPSVDCLLFCGFLDFIVPKLSAHFKFEVTHSQGASPDIHQQVQIKPLLHGPVTNKNFTLTSLISLMDGFWCNSSTDAWTHDECVVSLRQSRDLLSKLDLACENPRSSQSIDMHIMPLFQKTLHCRTEPQMNSKNLLDFSSFTLSSLIEGGRHLAVEKNGGSKAHLTCKTAIEIKGADLVRNSGLRSSLTRPFPAKEKYEDYQRIPRNESAWVTLSAPSINLQSPSEHAFTSMSDKAVQRGQNCIFCNFPCSVNVDPVNVAVLLQLLTLSNVEANQTQSGNSNLCSRSVLANRVNGAECEQTFTDSNSTNKKKNMFKFLQSLFDKMTFESSISLRATSLYLKVGVFEVGIGSLLFDGSTRTISPKSNAAPSDSDKVKHNDGDATYKDIGSSVSDVTSEEWSPIVDEANTKQNVFYKLLSQSQSTRKLEIICISLAMGETDSSMLWHSHRWSRPLCGHVRGSTISAEQVYLSNLVRKAGILPPVWSHKSSDDLLPFVRIGFITAELEDIRNLFLRFETSRLLLNILTLPLILRGMRAWYQSFSVMSSYCKHTAASNILTKNGDVTDLSLSRKLESNTTLFDGVTLPSTGQKGCQASINPQTTFHLTVQCKDTQANVHWLDLTRIIATKGLSSSTETSFCSSGSTKRLSGIPSLAYSGDNQLGDNLLRLVPIITSVPLFLKSQIASSKNTFVMRSSSSHPLFNHRAALVLATEKTVIEIDHSLQQTCSVFTNISRETHKELNEFLLQIIDSGNCFHFANSSNVLTYKPSIPVCSFQGSNNGNIMSTTEHLEAEYDGTFNNMMHCILGSRLEALNWDILDTDTGKISWRGRLRPTEACQLVLATPELVLSSSVHFHAQKSLNAKRPKASFSCNEWQQLSPFVRVRLLTHAQPIAGYTADLHLNGLLWAESQYDDSLRFSKSENLEKLSTQPNSSSGMWDNETARQFERMQGSRQRLIKRLDSLGLTRRVSDTRNLLSLDASPSSSLLKLLLRTTNLSCLISASLPLFCEPTFIRFEVPIIILTSTSTAAQQLACLLSNVVFNTEFFPIVHSNSKAKSRREIMRDTRCVERGQANVPKFPILIKDEELAVRSVHGYPNIKGTKTTLQQTSEKTQEPNKPISVFEGLKAKFLPKKVSESGDDQNLLITKSQKLNLECSDNHQEMIDHKNPVEAKLPNRQIVLRSLRNYFHMEEFTERLQKQHRQIFSKSEVYKEEILKDTHDVCESQIEVTTDHETSPSYINKNQFGSDQLDQLLSFTYIDNSSDSSSIVSDLSNDLTPSIYTNQDCSSEVLELQNTNYNEFDHQLMSLRSGASSEIYIEYEFQQISLSLAKEECIFCRCSLTNLIGSLNYFMSIYKNMKFEVDVGDIFIEAVPSSRHSAAFFPFNFLCSTHSTINDSQRIQTSSQPQLGPHPRKENRMILAPLYNEGEDLEAASVIAIRGSSRFVTFKYQNNKSENLFYSVKVYDSLMFQIHPLSVKLNQKLIENIYNFIFPLSPFQTSRDAIAVMNPKYAVPPNCKSFENKYESSTSFENSKFHNKSIKKETGNQVVFLRFFRIAPLVAEVEYLSAALNIKDVVISFRAFTRKDQIETIKHAIDRYIWYLGKQATTAVISHKFKGWFADKRGKRRQIHKSVEVQRQLTNGTKGRSFRPPLSDIQ